MERRRSKRISKPDAVRVYFKRRDAAQEYLQELRALATQHPSYAAVFFFNYGHRGRWSVMEGCLQALHRKSGCILEDILDMNDEELVEIFWGAGRANIIVSQLRKFCLRVQERFGSWDAYLDWVQQTGIPDLIKVTRSLKRALALKIFAAGDDQYVLHDRHLKMALGLSPQEKIETVQHYEKRIEPRVHEVISHIRKHDPKVTAALFFLTVWIEGTGISNLRSVAKP